MEGSINDNWLIIKILREIKGVRFGNRLKKAEVMANLKMEMAVIQRRYGGFFQMWLDR
jgi:hypothetical protein